MLVDWRISRACLLIPEAGLFTTTASCSKIPSNSGFELRLLMSMADCWGCLDDAATQATRGQTIRDNFIVMCEK